MRVGLRRKLGNCRRCRQSCALTPEARQSQGLCRGAAEAVLEAAATSSSSCRDRVAELDVIQVGHQLPICPAPSGAHAVPRHHSMLCTSTQRGRWPPASYAAEPPLCSRVPASHSASFFTDFGVCVLAGSTNANLFLAPMILVLTPLSSPWSPPACNHPNARHLSLGV